MIVSEEEIESSEHPTEKHVNVTKLMMTTNTPQIGSCLRDQCLPMRGYSGRDTFSRQFGAQEQANQPFFLEKPKSLTAEEGECIKFTCRLKGHPLPVVQWEKDGRQINAERIQITSNGDIFSLEIPHSTFTDAGRYVCVAVNDSGEARHMASLIVQKRSGQTSKCILADIKPSVHPRAKIRSFDLPATDQLCSNSQSLQKNLVDVRSKPSVEFQQVDYLAVDGGRICMSCNISGIPEPRVTWFREMLQIEISKAVNISYHSGVSSLELVSVSTIDSGTYTCQAENDLGISCAKCQLVIETKFQKASGHCATVEIVQNDLVVNSSKVAENSNLQQQDEKIINEIHSKVVTETSDSGKELLQNDDVETLPTNDDARHYQRQSKNSSDSPRSVSQEERRQSSKGVSASTPSSHLDILNSPSTNSCLKDVEFKARPAFTDNDNEKRFDYGGADDDDAFERPSHKMKSRLSDEPPLIEDLQPENINVLCGSEFQLIAKFCGRPIPQVNWYKGNELLTQDDRIRFETKPRCSKVTVMNAQPQDTGIYALVLLNEFGQDKQFSSVTIEDKPEPPVGPPAVTSILDNSLVLSWSGSSYDGGCLVLKYKVEISRNNTDIWECLTDDCQHTTYQVLNLVPNTEYVFRVSAANKHGFSIPGCSSEPIITNGVKQSIPTDDFPFLPRLVELEKDRKFADFYALGEVIGKGKFGSVYKCSDKSSDRLFAAKFIRTKSSQCSEFRQEIEIMNELHHPKLLLLWDAFESPREIILVMEHVRGGELMERIINDDYVLTERECIHFMRQICEGVVYMHSCNILHFDLKPENILCVTTNSNEIKIIDFGLARKFDPKKDFRIMFGTPEFVAPEVINYDTIGYTTDMWSVGVICYVLLSGLSPFLGENDKETFVNVTKAQFDFDDESFDDITEDAKDFISRLLVKDPRKRLLSEESLKHKWMAQDVTYMRAKKLSTAKHKKFMARSKWQKTGHALMALRRMVGLQRISSGNFEPCRSTSSLSSQTDSHSLVSDPNEVMSESDDSGFNSCQAQSLDSKSISVASKDLETPEDRNVVEQKIESASNLKTSLQGQSEDQVTSEEGSSMESSLTISEFSPDTEDALKHSKAEILSGKIEFEGKEEKETSQSNTISLTAAKDSIEGKAEGTCTTRFEDVCVANMERKTIQLRMKKQAIQSEISCTKETDTCFKKLTEPSVSQPVDQFKRKQFARRSFDRQTCSKLNEPFSRSFDQSRSMRVSEKLVRARNVFDNPSTSVTAQRNPVNSASKVKATSIKPFEFKLGTKTVPPAGDLKKPQVALGHTTSNSKNAESSSVAARKLAVQQFTAQRNTKPKKAPTFVRKMKNLDVVEGNLAKFEVLVDGNPSPTASWLKDGKEISALPQKYKTESNDAGKHSLTIVDCGEDDDAEYSCKASNLLGSIVTKANLYVEPVGEVLDTNSLPRNRKK